MPTIHEIMGNDKEDNWGRTKGLCFKKPKGKPRGWYYKDQFVAYTVHEAIIKLKEMLKELEA